MALEGHNSWFRVWKERFSWLFPHYFAFGAVGAVAGNEGLGRRQP